MKSIISSKKTFVAFIKMVVLFFVIQVSNQSYGQIYSATNQVIVTSTNSYSNAGRGFKFTPNVNLNLTELGKRIPLAVGNYTWTIWNNNTNTIVHQQASTSNTAAIYTYEPISSPVTLLAGISYSLMLYCDATAGAQYYYGSSSQVNSNLTYTTAVFCNSCTPNNNSTGVVANFHYGTPDFHFSTCALSYGTDTRTECAGYVWLDGITYTADNNSATYSISGGAANGCDSIVTLDLTIIPYPTGTDTRSECPGYTWLDGNTYTASNNTATHVLPGAASTGCDSLVVLNLTILPVPQGIDNQSSCGPYTWINGLTYTISTVNPTFTLVGAAANGCDSIAKLHLVVNSATTGTDTRTECAGYTWINGQSYYSDTNGVTFAIAGGAANGCDSIVTLNLTVNSVDVSLTVVDPTMTANFSGGTYQWLDCGTGFSPIAGATLQSFVPLNNGIYAAKITNNVNGCTDTSACTTIASVGIESNEFFKGVIVSPNPTMDFVSVQIEKMENIYLTNLRGQVVTATIESIPNGYKVNLMNLAPGLYFINADKEGHHFLAKIVKE